MLKRAILKNMLKEFKTPSSKSSGAITEKPTPAKNTKATAIFFESPPAHHKTDVVRVTDRDEQNEEFLDGLPEGVDTKQLLDSLRKKEKLALSANFTESFYSEEQTTFDPKYLLFRQTFNRKGDVIYGMSRPRAAYIEGALGKEAMVLGNGAPTADFRNRWIVPLNEEEATTPMPKQVEAYHQFLKAHSNSKFNDLSKREVVNNSDRTKYLTRSCKAFIDATVESGYTVHFLLDDGNHSWDLEAIVKKDAGKKAGTIITGKELRHIYKNREKFAGHIQFWKDGKKQNAPWEDDPTLWKEHFNEAKLVTKPGKHGKHN